MKIPTVSLAEDADEVAAAMRGALTRWGIFELVDHGVPQAVIDGAFAAAEHFFALPLDERVQVRVNRHNRGYVPLHQTVYEGNRPDLKESFNVGVDLAPEDPDVAAGKPLHGTNQWPSLPGFRAPVERYFGEMTDLGRRLLAPLAAALGVERSFLADRYTRPIAFLRLFHYPPDSRVDEREFGAAEHTDYGVLTILAQDSIGGLEARAPDGSWVFVEPRRDAFVINIGDMLSDMTEGKFRSAPHRVVNRARQARYSIPFFFDPDFDAVFETLPHYRSAGGTGRLAPTTTGAFLLKKFEQYYAWRKEPKGAAANA